MIRIAALVLVAMSGVAAAGSHCHEVSPVLGHQHCGSFGSRWAHRWFNGVFDVEGSLASVHTSVDAIDQTGTVSSTTTMAGYHATVPRGAMTTLGPRYWIGYRESLLDIGMEVTLSWALSGPTTTTQVDGFAPTSSSFGSVTDLGGRVGFHRHVGSVELGAQVFVGARTIATVPDLPDGFSTCDGGRTGKGCYLMLYTNHVVAEPRARVDLWLTPQVTLGAVVGVDLVAHGQSYAISIAFHGSPFDGE